MADTLRIASITGVDLEFRIAGPGGRSYAFVIDWHIRVVLMLAWYVIGMLLGIPDSAQPAVRDKADAILRTEPGKPMKVKQEEIANGEMLAGLPLPDIRGTLGTFYYWATDLSSFEEGNAEFGG